MACWVLWWELEMNSFSNISFQGSTQCSKPLIYVLRCQLRGKVFSNPPPKKKLFSNPPWKKNRNLFLKTKIPHVYALPSERQPGLRPGCVSELGRSKGLTLCCSCWRPQCCLTGWSTHNQLIVLHVFAKLKAYEGWVPLLLPHPWTYHHR